VLCAFVLFYGPLSCSMSLRSVLWPVILLYVPLFGSMARYLVLCAFVLFYGLSSCSMDPHPFLCSIRCLHQLVHLFLSLFLTPTTPEKSIDQVLFSNNAHHLILLFLF